MAEVAFALRKRRNAATLEVACESSGDFVLSACAEHNGSFARGIIDGKEN